MDAVAETYDGGQKSSGYEKSHLDACDDIARVCHAAQFCEKLKPCVVWGVRRLE
jgi:hypothetical protein